MSTFDDLPQDVMKQIFCMTDLDTLFVCQQMKNLIIEDQNVFTSLVVESIGSEKEAYLKAARHGKTSVIMELTARNKDLLSYLDQCEAMHDVIRYGHISTFEYLLSLEHDIGGWAPATCIMFGQFEMLKMLMSYERLGLDPNDVHPLGDLVVDACDSEHLDMLQYLLDMRDHDVFMVDYKDGRPLAMAAKKGNVDIVNLLLDRIPYIPKGHALLQAAEHGHTNIVKILLESPRNRPSANHKNGGVLLAAISGGYVDIVELVLNYPKNPASANCRSGIAFIDAARLGHAEVVKVLLNHPKNPPSANYHDGIALVAAAENGHIHVMKQLLEWPHNPPRADCNDGQALALAAEFGHKSCVELLLEWHEYAPSADCFDYMALDMSKENNHMSIFKMLYAKLDSDHIYRNAKDDAEIEAYNSDDEDSSSDSYDSSDEES
jgi:ankyrin repeat protein